MSYSSVQVWKLIIMVYGLSIKFLISASEKKGFVRITHNIFYSFHRGKVIVVFLVCFLKGRYCCVFGMFLFTWRPTWNYGDSTFSLSKTHLLVTVLYQGAFLPASWRGLGAYSSERRSVGNMYPSPLSVLDFLAGRNRRPPNHLPSECCYSAEFYPDRQRSVVTLAGNLRRWNFDLKSKFSVDIFCYSSFTQREN